MLSTLIYVLVVVVLVIAGVIIVDRTLPPDVQIICKVVLGVIGLIAILVKLLPMAGVS